LTTLVEPVGSAVLAYLILRERPTSAVLLGGVLILVGIYFASAAGKTEGN
jgi:drug/metabolite transporter (DMT)-like permease